MYIECCQNNNFIKNKLASLEATLIRNSANIRIIHSLTMMIMIMMVLTLTQVGQASVIRA